MLDTNICSYIIRKHPVHIKEKLKQISRENTVALSSIVVSELFYGAYKKDSKKLINLIELFIDSFEIYEFGIEAAKEYGILRSELEKQGLPIGAYDMQIAAHAISLEAILVTNNEKEFKRIKRLKIENWM
jgi:tRNA(fMet)-specific endonuclease VapC